MVEGESDSSLASTDERVFASYDDATQKKLYQPQTQGNRKIAQDAKKKLPCFMLSNCINPATCGYSHEVSVYENFLKTVVEYIKSLKDKAPSIRMIEEHFNMDPEGARLSIDDDILTNFMHACMEVVNEQLTPAYIRTEIIDESGNDGRPRRE